MNRQLEEFPVDKRPEKLAQLLNERRGAKQPQLNADHVRPEELARRLSEQRNARQPQLNADHVRDMFKAQRFAEPKARELADVLGVAATEFGDFLPPIPPTQIGQLAALRRGASRDPNVALIPPPGADQFEGVPVAADLALLPLVHGAATVAVACVPRSLDCHKVGRSWVRLVSRFPFRFGAAHARYDPDRPDSRPEYFNVLNSLIHAPEIPRTQWARFFGVPMARPAARHKVVGWLATVNSALTERDYESLDDLLAPECQRVRAGKEILDRLLAFQPEITHTTVFSGDEALPAAGAFVARLKEGGSRRVLVVAHPSSELDAWIEKSPLPVTVVMVPFFEPKELADELGKLVTPGSDHGKKLLLPLLEMPSVTSAVQAGLESGHSARQLVADINDALRREFPHVGNEPVSQGLASLGRS